MCTPNLSNSHSVCIEFDVYPSSEERKYDENDWSVLGPYDNCRITETTIDADSPSPLLQQLLAPAVMDEMVLCSPRKKIFKGLYAFGLDDDFANPKIFQIVSFVHFQHNCDEAKPWECFKNQFDSNAKCRNKISLKKIAYRAYYSLDCCDRMLIMRSNDHSALFEAIKTLSNSSHIHYTYSLCCMTRGAIAKSFLKNTVPVYVRFPMTVKTPEILKELEITNENGALINCYSMLGHEDIFHGTQDITIKKLAKLQRKIYEIGAENIITTILYPTEKISEGSALTFGHPTKAEVDNWIKSFRKIQLLPQDFQWNFLELLKEIRHIAVAGYAKTVLTQLGTVIPRFIEMLKATMVDLQPDGVLSQQYSEYCSLMNRFLRGIGYLLQYTTNSDLQFVQFPGRVPTLIEYSAKLTAAYSAYCYCVARSLHDVDAEPSAKYQFLMVPKVCTRIKIQQIFPLRDASFQQKPCERIIYLDIPSSFVSNVQLTLISLTHEIAHVVGHDLRKRDARGKCFINCAVIETLRALNIFHEDINNDEISILVAAYCNQRHNSFESFHTARLKEQAQTINEGLKDKLNNSRQIFIELYKKFGFLSKDGVETYASCSKAQIDELDWEIRRQRAARMNVAVNTFITRVNEYISSGALTGNEDCSDMTTLFGIVNTLISLFKECYADVIMLSILKLKLSDYVASFWQSEAAFLDNYPAGDQIIFELIDKTRIQCVMMAFNMANSELWKLPETKGHSDFHSYCESYWKLHSNDDMKEGHVSKEQIDAFLHCFYDAWTDSEENKISSCTIYAIAKYLSGCIETFQDKDRPKDKKVEPPFEEIRQIYQALCSFDTETVMQEGVYRLLTLAEKRILDNLAD